MAKIGKFRCDRCTKDEETTNPDKPEKWRDLLGPDKRVRLKPLREQSRLIVCEECGVLIEQQANALVTMSRETCHELPPEIMLKNVTDIAKRLLSGTSISDDDDDDDTYDEDEDDDDR